MLPSLAVTMVFQGVDIVVKELLRINNPTSYRDVKHFLRLPPTVVSLPVTDALRDRRVTQVPRHKICHPIEVGRLVVQVDGSESVKERGDFLIRWQSARVGDLAIVRKVNGETRVRPILDERTFIQAGGTGAKLQELLLVTWREKGPLEFALLTTCYALDNEVERVHMPSGLFAQKRDFRIKSKANLRGNCSRRRYGFPLPIQCRVQIACFRDAGTTRQSSCRTLRRRTPFEVGAGTGAHCHQRNQTSPGTTIG